MLLPVLRKCLYRYYYILFSSFLLFIDVFSSFLHVSLLLLPESLCYNPSDDFLRSMYE